MECPRCSKEPLSSDASHYARHHFRLPKIVWPCRTCSFHSLSFPDSLSHCFLDGHELDGAKIPVQSKVAKASEIASSSHSDRQSEQTSNQAGLKEVSPPVASKRNQDGVRASNHGNANFASNPSEPDVPIQSVSASIVEIEAPMNMQPPMKSNSFSQPQSASSPIAGQNNLAEGTINLEAESVLLSESANNTHCSDNENAVANNASQTVEEYDLGSPDGNRSELMESIFDTGALIDSLQDTDSEDEADASDDNIFHPTEQGPAAPGSVDCERCSGRLKTNNLPRHVLRCLGLKPFVCTACSASFAELYRAKHHMAKEGQCSGGEVGVQNRLETEARVIEGLRTCFPNVQHTWRGFTTQLPDVG